MEKNIKPIKSVVSVRFGGTGMALSYFNDRFDLRVGDVVYVSGKHSGKRGCVEAVTTKFKINLRDYERVIACPRFELHGEYKPMLDKMVSFDVSDADVAAFRDTVIAPATEDDDSEIIVGEGYRFDLDSFETDEEIKPAILQRAADYCAEGLVKFISVIDGAGTAFVEGSEWYEVNFVYDVDGTVTDMYCDCPYPWLCKHCLAVLLTLRMLLREIDGASSDFIAIDRNLFLNTVAAGNYTVSI